MSTSKRFLSSPISKKNLASTRKPINLKVVRTNGPKKPVNVIIEVIPRNMWTSYYLNVPRSQIVGLTVSVRNIDPTSDFFRDPVFAEMNQMDDFMKFEKLNVCVLKNIGYERCFGKHLRQLKCIPAGQCLSVYDWLVSYFQSYADHHGVELIKPTELEVVEAMGKWPIASTTSSSV
eukprot:Awhi_evm1s1930